VGAWGKLTEGGGRSREASYKKEIGSYKHVK
jgi:hypothetical protein